MRSLPVAILAAIAFISTPSLLPETADGMKRSVAVVECSEQYEIIAGGKTVASFDSIAADTTLCQLKEKADSDTEHKATVCGCWMNRLSFIPSCRGRIFAADPFAGRTDCTPAANRNIAALIGNTIRETEAQLKTHERRSSELHYYLDTHSVKDEGYNTMAAYAEENNRRRASMEKSLQLLENIRGRKDVRIRIRRTYTLLYPTADGRKAGRAKCDVIAEESSRLPKGTLMLQTQNGFIPENTHAVYRFDVFRTTPEKGDTITAAGIFGLGAASTAAKALQRANVFKGCATSAQTHDIPPLLAPEGAPLFNRHGFFIGINMKGGIAR